jgi:hypothetical protein
MLWDSVEGRNSSAGIEIRYRLDGPGIKSRCGEAFLIRPDRPCGPPSLLYNRYRVFTGGKSGHGVALTTHPHLAPRLKKEYSLTLLPLWAFVACSRVNFTFTFYEIVLGFSLVSRSHSIRLRYVMLKVKSSLHSYKVSAHTLKRLHHLLTSTCALICV